jgi:hypothetical protein
MALLPEKTQKGKAKMENECSSVKTSPLEWGGESLIKRGEHRGHI